MKKLQSPLRDFIVTQDKMYRLLFFFFFFCLSSMLVAMFVPISVLLLGLARREQSPAACLLAFLGSLLLALARGLPLSCLLA